jgi:ABC-type phosphate/phosphonate transport system permease subunit
MKFFMKQFTAENEEATNSNTFRLGMAMAILSALVYSAFAFANVAFISPDLFTEQMDAMMQQMAPMMDSNTMSVMETYMENLAQITFFTNLIYCFIYGTVLSFILSRNIPSKNPFAEYKPEQ